MGFREARNNFRVTVEPRSPGDHGFIRISGWTQTEAEWERDCENIAEQIRRHVDGLPSYRGRGVSVEWDVERTCEHCGSMWTEKSTSYNGGCCAEDEKANPDTPLQKQGA